MSNLRVLFLYPNERSMSLVPPVIALFSRLLKDRGCEVDLFDTSGYAIEGGAPDADKVNARILALWPFHLGERRIQKQGNVFEELNRKVELFRPDLIAVSADESTFLLGIRLLRSVRHHKVLTILGGVFATFAPEIALSYPEINIVCIGDGEVALVELCERLRALKDYSNVTNLWMKQKDGSTIRNPLAPPVNIDDNGLPDFTIFEDNRFYRAMAGKMYRMLPIETHRGCVHACGFCNSPSQNKLYWDETKCKFFRKKSINKVYEELIYCRDAMKAEYFFFWADEFFAYSKHEIDEFCEMYSDIRLPFYCQARPESITDYKIRRLKKVGMHRLGVGLEHGNEKFRREVVNRPYSNKLAIERLRIPARYGVTFSVNNIIGFPDETPELAMDTVELNRQIDAADTRSCSIFAPFHGTPLRELAIKRGYLNPNAIAQANTDDSILDMPNFTRDQIHGLRRTFNMYVKFPKSRWNEIRLAEQLTPQGDAVWNKLREEFDTTFFTSLSDGD